MDVYPSLTYRDVRTALAFLERAFGFETEDAGRDQQGAIRYAALRYGEGLVLIQPDLPDELHGTHLGQGWVYVEVPDVDEHFAQARAASPSAARISGTYTVHKSPAARLRDSEVTATGS
jgi:uncharacterized glyoxalase superfamily protein PhnB